MRIGRQQNEHKRHGFAQGLLSFLASRELFLRALDRFSPSISSFSLMKTLFLTGFLLLAVLNSFGQQAVGVAAGKGPEPKTPKIGGGAYSIIQQDANSRVWMRTNYEKLPSG